MAQSKTGEEGNPFDIREYGEAARDLTLAAESLNEMLTTTEQLLGSQDLEQGIQKVNSSVDNGIMTVADQSAVVMDAFFWRACALLGVLLLMLVLYRAISLLLQRRWTADS